EVGREDRRVAREPTRVGDDVRKGGCDDRLVERSEQQHDHQRRVDGEDPADREPVAGGLSRQPFAKPLPHWAASTGTGALRASMIPAAIATPPAIWRPLSDSESSQTAKRAPMNGCRLANSVACEGPTRSSAVYQSTFVSTSGPSTAKASRSQTEALRP